MFIKSIFDKIFSLFGLLILWPLFSVFMFLSAIKMRGGPVYFTQKRVGKNGYLFTMYKFRSMAVNHNGSSVSIKGENRITPLGAILRKYKIDELPALWNVLIGDMSLVGPRPDVPGYADLLQGDDRMILSVKPGITGLASLKYRNEEAVLAQQPNPQYYNDAVIWPDKVRINCWYVQNRSWQLDLLILFYTLLPFSIDVDEFITKRNER